MTSNLAFQVRFLVGLPFYWFVVKWPNTTGFDPVIRRFKSCRTCHLVLHPLLQHCRICGDGYYLSTGSSGVDHHWGVSFLIFTHIVLHPLLHTSRDDLLLDQQGAAELITPCWGVSCLN